MAYPKQANIGVHIANTLKKFGINVLSDDNDKPLFCCRIPIQNYEIIKGIFLGVLHYSLFYKLDIVQRLCANEKKILNLSKANENKKSLTSNILSIFKEINSLINNKQISNATFQNKPEAIHAEIVTIMQMKKGEYNHYDFLKAFSQMSSIDILLLENAYIKHFTISKPTITIFLKLENSNWFLLYPKSYSNDLISHLCSIPKSITFDILSCGHPFPNCVYKEGQSLTNYVLSYLQYPCQCPDSLFDEEKKNIIKTCKNNNAYWKTNCAECLIALNGSGVKCQKCEFSYCMKKDCKIALKIKDKYLCKICNAILSRSRNKRGNSPRKQRNEVKETKVYKDYEIPVKNHEKNCNHSSEIVFYCRDCSEISYQYDEIAIKNILCKGCNLFFQNKDGFCLICIYKFHAEEKKKRQIMGNTDPVAGVDIKFLEDNSEIGTEGNMNPLPN